MGVDELDELTGHLAAARERRALSRRQLSVRLGFVAAVVAKWESGTDVPTVLHFVAWARHLGYAVVLVDPAGKSVPDRPQVKPGESFERYEVRRVIAVLKKARLDAGFTQEALGKELGANGLTASMCTRHGHGERYGEVSWRTILMWETQRRQPPVMYLLAWAARFSYRITLEPLQPGDA